MLIEFETENFLSIKEPIKLKMMASTGRKFNQYLPSINKLKIKILPVGCVFGANASGKTNIFKAITFLRNLVITPRDNTTMLNVITYKLDKKYLDKPTKFRVQLLADDENIYELTVKLNSASILEERLDRINSQGSKTLYIRNEKGIKLPYFEDKAKHRLMFLQFAAKGTQKNQLFLSNTVSQNINEFRCVYD